MRLTFDLSTDNALSIYCHCHGLFYKSTTHIVLLYTKDHCTNAHTLNKRDFDTDNTFSIYCHCHGPFDKSKTHFLILYKNLCKDLHTFLSLTIVSVTVCFISQNHIVLSYKKNLCTDLQTFLLHEPGAKNLLFFFIKETSCLI